MSKKLYTCTEIVATGIDQDGAFVVVKTETHTDNKKTKKEIKLYIHGRLWVSNEYDDYAWSNSTGGKNIFHSDKVVENSPTD